MCCNSDFRLLGAGYERNIFGSLALVESVRHPGSAEPGPETYAYPFQPNVKLNFTFVSKKLQCIV